MTGKGGGDGDYKSRCVRWALDADNDVGPARNLQFIRYLSDLCGYSKLFELNVSNWR